METLSIYFGVQSEAWMLSNDAFIEHYAIKRRAPEEKSVSAPANVSFRAIEAYKHLWKSAFDIHRGQYIGYWKAADLQGHYVANLVEISGISKNGLEFTLINPYIRDDVDQDNVRTWRYSGVVYPVADYLYFYGEQIDSAYELFSMIMTASPIAPPDLLRGCLSGIHVKDGRKDIAVNIVVVLMFLRKPIANWRSEIGERLGKLPAGKVPSRVRKLLEPYPGVISLR